MKHTKLFVAASAIAFAFTTLTPSGATANESSHGLHKGHDHQSMGEGHKGHDHDKDPVKFTMKYTKRTCDIGFYSRLRKINPNSSFSVIG